MDALVRANFTLPPALLDAFRARCEASGEPMSHAVRRMIEGEMKKPARAKPEPAENRRVTDAARAAAELTARDSEILYLHEVEKKSLSQLASKYKITSSGVSRALKRARAASAKASGSAGNTHQEPTQPGV